MPNWCNNTVEISHSDTAKMEALVAAINEGKFCQHVIPTPRELTETVAGFPGEDKRAEHEAQVASNLERFGHSDWYSFQTSRWGTKWDVDAYDTVVLEGNSITFGFDSAWSPPVGVYEQLVEDGFSVRAYYYEPGMAFCGVWEDMGDDFYELSGMSSEEVADTIPSDLDEAFGISETMREYEEMEKDEVQVWYEDGVEKQGLEPHKNV